jgi:hypothetical protein
MCLNLVWTRFWDPVYWNHMCSKNIESSHAPICQHRKIQVQSWSSRQTHMPISLFLPLEHRNIFVSVQHACACMFVSKQRTVPSCFPNCSAYSGWPRTVPPSLTWPHVNDCLLSVCLLFVSVLFLSLYMYSLFLKFLASQVSVCSLRACFRKVKYHTVSVFLSLQQKKMVVSASVSW